MAEGAFSFTEVSLLSFVLKASLLTLVCFSIHRFFDKDRKHYRYPPGPVGLPFIGSLLSLIATKKQQHEVVSDWMKKYGDVISFKLLNIRVYILSDATLARDVFGSLHAMDRMPTPIIKALTGRENAGIVFSNGDVWKEQRRFFLSFFRKAGVRFEEIIRTQVERLLTEMEATKGQQFDPNLLINMSIGNISTKIMTGITYDYDDAKFHRFLVRSKRFFELIGPGGIFSAAPILAVLPSSSKRHLMEQWKGVYDFIKESIESHKAGCDPDQEANDFIDSYLLEMERRSAKMEKRSFDEINLLVCLFDLLLTWETSSNTILWSLHILAFNADAQRRVRQEIFDVIGQRRPPRFSDRHKMPVTLATIAECMRLRPADDFHLLHVATQDCKVGEYDIPKGSVITMNMPHMFHSSSLYDKPLEFRPHRFLNEDGEFNKQEEPFFFGTGRRVCPGEQLARTEVFLFVTFILQRFIITPHKRVPEDLQGRHGLTIQPGNFDIYAVKIG